MGNEMNSGKMQSEEFRSFFEFKKKDVKLVSLDEKEKLICDRVKKKLSGEVDALILLDLDDFHRINTMYDRETGDGILKCVAEILQDVFDTEDIISLMEEDDFTIYTSGRNTQEEIEEKVQRVCMFVRRLSSMEGLGIDITCSIGVTVNEGNADYITMKKQAEQALAIAKNNGKNQSSFWKQKA